MRFSGLLLTSILVILFTNQFMGLNIDISVQLEFHDPIEIEGNADFRAQASAEDWPGDGSQGNPYVISGLKVSRIYVSHVDVFFQITNCSLGGEIEGIMFFYAENGQVYNNTISDCDIGIALSVSIDNIIRDNTIQKCQVGVYVDGSDNTINNNSFVDNEFGSIVLSEAPNNVINGNSMVNGGLRIFGREVEQLLQTEVVDNVVNGKPLIFWQNVDCGIVPQGVGQIVLVNTSHITITGQHLSHTSVGIAAAFSQGLRIYNNTIKNTFREGIIIYPYSNFNTICNNIICNNFHGVWLFWSSNNIISNNTIRNNNKTGIAINFSYNNTISHNMIQNASEHGIYLEDASNNTIKHNFIKDSKFEGIALFYSSYNNQIYENNFIRNNPEPGASYGISQAISIVRNNNNIFSHNYWSDWTTPDDNADGIVDNPYPITSGISEYYDLYPVTTPYDFDIHVLSAPRIIFPNGGEILSDVIRITWTAATDSHSHPVTYTLSYSSSGGMTCDSWIILTRGLTTPSYDWDTSLVDNGETYLIMINCSCSGGSWQIDISDKVFAINNPDPSPTSSSKGLPSKEQTTEPTSEKNISNTTHFLSISCCIIGLVILCKRKKISSRRNS